MPKRKRPQKRAGLRGLVVRAHGSSDCAICGKPTLYGAAHQGDPDYMTLDHTLALSRGGDHHLSNLRPAHQRCNELLGNLTDEEIASGEYEWAT